MITLFWDACSASTGNLVRRLLGRSSGVGFFNTPTVPIILCLPMYDLAGSVRGLADATGAVTDTYTLEAFGKQLASTGTTPNPYRFGAAWGYITDPSGFLQLGARYYWPEVGRFVSQDPIGLEQNWYAYAADGPTVRLDADGRYRRRRDKCEGLIRAARDLEGKIRNHIAFMQGGGLVAGGPQAAGPRFCSGGGFDHAKEVRQMQARMQKLLKQIAKHCDKKQRDYFGGEIGKFRGAAECPVPENPLLPMVPSTPSVPGMPRVPAPQLPPLRLPPLRIFPLPA